MAERSRFAASRLDPPQGNDAHPTTTANPSGRSDDKGPEPENLTIGEIDGRTYAFIGFERVGGIMVYDITDPASASYVSYVNNRDFSISVEDADDPAAVLSGAGDLGPEGLTFIPASESATGEPLLAVGNREFDAGFADLTDRVLPRYESPTFGLGANVYVGFIGVVTPDTANMVTPTGISDLEFGDQLEAANRVAMELTEADAADVVVLLPHSGTGQSGCEAVQNDTSSFGELITGASEAIDAIVSAHTHQSYECSIPGPTGVERPMIQAHQYGTTLGKLDIAVDAASKELVSVSSELVPLVVDGAATFAEDPAVAQIIADAVAVAGEKGSVNVGSITADILRGGGDPAGSDRGVESVLGNTIADVYLWATSNEGYAGTPADIAIMNPGGLRTELLYGEGGSLTYRDVAAVQPFANTFVTVDLTGAQLQSLLEEQWRMGGAAVTKPHPGVSEGFSYEYDPEAPLGEHIVSMSYNGAPVAAEDVFTVATNSFLAADGNAFATFTEDANSTDTGQVDLTATVDYFAEHGPVAPVEVGRAVVAGDGGPVVTVGPTGPTATPMEPTAMRTAPAEAATGRTTIWRRPDPSCRGASRWGRDPHRGRYDPGRRATPRGGRPRLSTALMKAPGRSVPRFGRAPSHHCRRSPPIHLLVIFGTYNCRSADEVRPDRVATGFPRHGELRSRKDPRRIGSAGVFPSRCPSRAGSQSRSRMRAFAMPPPSHMVCRP